MGGQAREDGGLGGIGIGQFFEAQKDGIFRLVNMNYRKIWNSAIEKSLVCRIAAKSIG